MAQIQPPLQQKESAAGINRKSSRSRSYGDWPAFIDLGDKEVLDMLAAERRRMQDECLEKTNPLAIETFKQTFAYWKEVAAVKSETCHYFLNEMFLQLFDVEFRANNLVLPSKIVDKAKKWLDNRDDLLEQALNQQLVVISNRYTYEQNICNPLRTKKPSKKPAISPDIYYKQVINETLKECDFCDQNTALSEFGRLVSNHSYSAANMFPYDKYHEMFLPFKHDFLDLAYHEFKDLIYLPLKWFKKVYEKNPVYSYPVLFWDFLIRAGASQVHPHLHGTMSSDKYYGVFEIIRNGAKAYYEDLNQNYFSDLIRAHNLFGLTLFHKNASLIFPLNPRKEYDALIISQTFNDGTAELLYTLLRTYMIDLKLYPFSLTIYYPSLNKENSEGRIPVYIRIIPRGDISSLRSDFSSLELMTINNVNLNQFDVFENLKAKIEKKLNNLD